MKKTKKVNHIFLLAVLVSLSIFELGGVQAAVLLICISSALWLFVKQDNVVIPAVVFVAVAYILGYSMPMLFPSLYPSLWNKVSSSALEYGMLWSVRGFGAFALGFALVEYHKKRSSRQGWIGETLVKNYSCYTFFILTSIGYISLIAWFVTVTLFGVSLVFMEGDVVDANTAGGTLLQMLTLLINLRYPFFVGYLILYNCKQTNSKLFFLFVALICVSVFEIIVIGSKGSIIRLMMMGVLAHSFLHIKLNFKQIVRILLMLIAVYGSFSVITEYRSIMHAEYKLGKNVLDFEVQLESFKSAFLLSLPFSESFEERQTKVDSSTTLSRFGAGIFSFANLLEFTFRRPPYVHAFESFLVPIYSLLPRFLMPEKPVFFDSGSYARAYYGWSYGGISVSLLGSFYYAWGYAGVVFGMMFLGCFLAYVAQQAIFSNKYAVIHLILLVFLLLSLTNVGETFQSVITNFIRISLVLWSLHLLYPLICGARGRRGYGIQASQERGRR